MRSLLQTCKGRFQILNWSGCAQCCGNGASPKAPTFQFERDDISLSPAERNFEDCVCSEDFRLSNVCKSFGQLAIRVTHIWRHEPNEKVGASKIDARFEKASGKSSR